MRTLAALPNVFLAWIANSMHSMASAVFPLPDALRNLSPMMLVVQFTTTTPELLLPLAPIVPETWLPWLLSSSGLQVLLTALKPCDTAGQLIVWPPTVTVNAAGADQMFAARSGWL